MTDTEVDRSNNKWQEQQELYWLLKVINLQINRGVVSPADISMDIKGLVELLGTKPTSFHDGVKATLEIIPSSWFHTLSLFLFALFKSFQKLALFKIAGMSNLNPLGISEWLSF